MSKPNSHRKIGLGGGCHWCTEGVFSTVKGIVRIEQGWIKSDGHNDSFSEAIIIHFDEQEISLKLIIEMHLMTHSCTSNHNLRMKYRSAIYTFEDMEMDEIEQYIMGFSSQFDHPIITKVLPFVEFKLNEEQYLDYYTNNKEKPFCKRYIDPKIKNLQSIFGSKIIEP